MTTEFVKRYTTQFVTDYGIREVLVAPLEGNMYVAQKGSAGNLFRTYFAATMLHETLEDAQRAAIKARDESVDSLEIEIEEAESEIARLKAMTFDTVREG